MKVGGGLAMERERERRRKSGKKLRNEVLRGIKMKRNYNGEEMKTKGGSLKKKG